MMRNDPILSHPSRFYEALGPTIRVDWHLEGDSIVKISLNHSELIGTEWFIHGESLDSINAWMDQYLSRREPTITLPLRFPELPPFSKQVLEALRGVSFGETVSYQSLGALAGNPTAARAVGGACGRNPFPLVIPCHRVLAKGQRLGGFTPGTDLKQQLLAFESITLA